MSNLAIRSALILAIVFASSSAALSQECQLALHNHFGNQVYVHILDNAFEGNYLTPSSDPVRLEEDPDEPKVITINAERCDIELRFQFIDCQQSLMYETIALPDEMDQGIPLFFSDQPFGAIENSYKCMR